MESMFFQLCGIFFVLQVHLIDSYSGEVYLKREKRKSQREQNFAAAFPDPNGSSDTFQEKRKNVNPLSELYSSGNGSGTGSGFDTGSGINENIPQESLQKHGAAQANSGSGGDVESDIDSSLAELLGDGDADASSSSGNFATSDENMSGQMPQFGGKSQVNRKPDETPGFDAKEQVSLVAKKPSRGLEINKRSLETGNKMALLEEFFRLMSAPEEKKTNKRNSDDNENVENEIFKAASEFHGESDAKIEETRRSIREDISFLNHEKEVDGRERGRQLRISKREAEDLGDETIPNLSYIQNDHDKQKISIIENDGKSEELVKRDFVDGDNSVRFLEEVNTENLFTKHEEEMLERITRRKRNEGGDLSRSSSAKVIRNEKKHEDFPMIRLVMSDAVRPKRESERTRKKAVRQHQEAKEERTIEKSESHKQSEVISKRNVPFPEPEANNANDQRENIELVFVRKRNKANIEKRGVILDKDADADTYMANIGAPTPSMKEKRYLRKDETLMYKAPIFDKNIMTDADPNLVPLENEYLENLKKRGLDEQNEGSSKISTASEKKSLESGRAELPKTKREDFGKLEGKGKIENSKQHVKKDFLIGTFAKPTEVSGFWSGLGSKPIFIEKDSKNEDDAASGSGLSEDAGKQTSKKSVKKKKGNLFNIKKNKMTRKFNPEEIGGIMEKVDAEEKYLKGKEREINVDKKKLKASKERRKRMDKEVEDIKNKKNDKKSQSVLTFDEMHEIVSKNEQKDAKSRKNKEFTKRNDDANGDDDTDVSGDEESGEEETEKVERSYPEDEIVVKTLSATYRENDVIDKRNKIMVKRAPNDNGYIGCYVDVLHPMRDLAVRAGIPFVTINNCRSACKRTGYYYAGLQFGYLCFCGNTYGKYDMAPDSECNYACSGDGNQTCGGLWRNSIYFTAGAPTKSNEGPVPFYLPPNQKASMPEMVVKRSEIPQVPVSNVTYATNTSQSNYYANYSTQATAPIPATPANQNEVDPHVETTMSNSTVNVVSTQTAAPNTISENSEREQTGGKKPEGKRKVLMHFAYLHQQEHREVKPTNPPAPTPPLRIEPQTRVFKGEIKLKQKWFDEFKDKMSTKSQILAGNVEQALKNVYANSSDQKEFLKAEVLSFREGLINNNPYTVTRVIVEFTLTFDQNVISPDARLFARVRSTKKLDEMPVFARSLKVSEYRFDPNSPNQAFMVPLKEPLAADQLTDPDDRRKSNIAFPGDAPNTQDLNAYPRMQVTNQQAGTGLSASSDGMQELQSYLASEKSLPPVIGQQSGMIRAEQQTQVQKTQGVKTELSGANELSKRSEVPRIESNEKKVPYILRLFFWKDMLARRKRQSANDKRNFALLRGRRGDVEEEEKRSEKKLAAKEKNDDVKIKRRFDNSQIPLTEESSFERRFMKKTKRRTKDLTTEKELRRSKRLDEFEDFD